MAQQLQAQMMKLLRPDFTPSAEEQAKSRRDVEALTKKKKSKRMKEHEESMRRLAEIIAKHREVEAFSQQAMGEAQRAKQAAYLADPSLQQGPQGLGATRDMLMLDALQRSGVE
jgi:hypothetical protein